MSRYTIDAFKRALREPGRLVGEIRRLSAKANAHLQFESSNKWMNVMTRDWDILIILDGCRLDLFNEESTLDGQTKSIDSGATRSIMFLKRHFSGGRYHDTVYISGNPYTNTLEPDVFHNIINVYDTHWHDNLGTVTPENITKETLRAASKYPQKRLIAHFMQPHYPFIGEMGRRLDTGDLDTGTGPDIWAQLNELRCDANKETVWEAYAENYKLTENFVERLDREINGKTVITADHGNLFGERLQPIPVKYYGHATNAYHPSLHVVPWHEMPVTERRETQRNAPVEADEINKEELDAKLRALGYH